MGRGELQKGREISREWDCAALFAERRGDPSRELNHYPPARDGNRISLRCHRKPPDALSINLHHRHRNAKFATRGDEVVVERLDLNGVTKGIHFLYMIMILAAPWFPTTFQTVGRTALF